MVGIEDLCGRKFGRLTVIKPSGRKYNYNTYWLCICDCGNEKEILDTSLKNGTTKSCGCLNLEKIIERNKSRTPKNKLAYGEASFNLVYRTYKKGAKTRNLDFELSKDDFRNLTQQNCYYCNRKPNQIQKPQDGKGVNGEYIYNGIDRVDNSKGYILNNCVPCCGECNFKKSFVTVEICRKVIAFINAKGEENERYAT